MKKNILLLLFLTLTSVSFAQSTFGWNIVLEGTKYKTLMPEGYAFYNTQFEKNTKIYINNFPAYRIGIGEPVLVIDNYKGGVLALDPQGRMVFIADKKTLFPVNQYEYVTVGSLQEEISTLDGEVYQKGRYFLIVGQSLEKNTYTVLLDKTKKLDIPTTKILLIRDYYTEFFNKIQLSDAERL